MKLKDGLNDQIFAGWPAGIPFQSVLPPAPVMSGAEISPFLAELVKGNGSSLLFDQSKNALSIARTVLQWDAGVFGVRAAEVSAVADLFQSAALISLDDKRTIVDYLNFANQVLEGVWDLVDSALSTFAAVPLVGIIFQAAKMILDGITLLFKHIEEERKKGRKPPPDAIAYDKDADEYVTRKLLDAAKLRDWTGIFSPYSTEPWTHKGVDFTKGGIVNGWKWGPGSIDARNTELGWGCFPQLAEQFGDFQIASRYAREDHFWRARPSGFSQFHPSLVQASVVLWQRVMDYNSRMFSVDMDRIVSEWGSYFGEGFELSKRLLKADKQTKGLANMRTLALSVAESCSFTMLLGRDAGNKKGTACGGTATYRNYNCWTMPDEYLSPAMSEFGRPVSFAELIRYVHQKVWMPRAEACLKTIVCAYVDDSPDFPGLRHAGPRMKWHWREMRKLLLTRTAVRDVEVDLIPDQEYRSAVVQAQKSIKEIVLAPSPSPGADSPFVKLDLSLVIDVDPPPEPPTGLDPGVDGEGGPEGGGGGIALAALGALGLFAAFR